MYVVHSRKSGNVWQQESRHRLFERAQDSARRLTDARYCLRARKIMHHRDDVVILTQKSRGGVCYYLGPKSHEY